MSQAYGVQPSAWPGGSSRNLLKADMIDLEGERARARPTAEDYRGHVVSVGAPERTQGNHDLRPLVARHERLGERRKPLALGEEEHAVRLAVAACVEAQLPLGGEVGRLKRLRP